MMTSDSPNGAGDDSVGRALNDSILPEPVENLVEMDHDNDPAEIDGEESPEVEQEEEPVVAVDEVVPMQAEIPAPIVHDLRIPQENGYGGYSDDDSDADPNENVQDGYYVPDFDGDQWDARSAGSHNTDRRSRNADSDEGEASPEFNPELPARHIYLGEAMEELQGRVVLDEDSVLEIPIVVMNFHLIPGQTLPMTVFHAVFQNAIRRCVVNDRVFGVVNSGIESIDGRFVVSKNALGTVAEIYEFQEESDQPANPIDVMQIGTNFALKAKGRQRFNVLEVRRQADGNLMARVRIRPEIHLPSLMAEVLSSSTMRYQFPRLSFPLQHELKAKPDDEEENGASNGHHGQGDIDKQNWESRHETNMENLGTAIKERRPATKYYSAFTPWPNFVYENYDERMLVYRIHKKLRNELKGLTESHTNIPLDATELSFWLAQNLTMDDSIRFQLLKMDSAIQRLRLELNLLDNVSRVISCRRCLTTVADYGDIFAMSTEGPQGTYVNPNGFIHETLTVHSVRDMITRGFPSTEASWFQGYSWTIAECRACRQHLGWKFRATGRLKPKKFWGLARKSVTFKYNLATDIVMETNTTASVSRPTNRGTPFTLPPLMPP